MQRMIGKFEAFGLGACIMFIAVALYVTQVRSTFTVADQPAGVAGATQALSVVGGTVGDTTPDTNNTTTMTIDDIKIGTGAEAQNGNTVAVHYVGTLQDGTEFDNSHKRGAPIEFTLGAGQVIAGWEEGILGMQVGGERTLVIPSEKAYGDAGIGPIPGGATLLFTVSLVEIK